MPLLPKKKAAPVVHAGAATETAAGAGNRIVKMELPVLKKLSQAQIDALETESGKDVLAVCDFTGEPIYNQANINAISNAERPELDGKVMSTKFLSKLLEAVGNPVAIKKLKGEKERVAKPAGR